MEQAMVEELNNINEETKNEDLDEWKDWGKHYTNRVTWGISLIFLGALFLLETFNIIPIHFYNWWAVFILVPGINSLLLAGKRFQQTGQINHKVQRAGFRGLLLILVALTFFLNLDWGIMFSILLIGAGIYLLLRK
jgi:hypothetical protein